MPKRTVRSNSLRKLAHDLDGLFIAKDNSSMMELLRDFKIFKPGGTKTIYNVIAFADGDAKLYIFDYKYVIRSQYENKTYRQTILFINSKQLGLPNFSMRPEHIFHQLGQWLNFTQDIDFDAFPEFSKQYFLKGPHENFIRYTFTEDVLEFFSDEKGWSAEGLNYFFVFYKKNKLIRSDHLKGFINKGLKLYDFLQEEEEEE